MDGQLVEIQVSQMLQKKGIPIFPPACSNRGINTMSSGVDLAFMAVVRSLEASPANVGTTGNLKD